MVRYIGDLARSSTDKFGIWLAGYYDDFHSCRMISNDDNAAFPDSYDHKLTHYGNLFTGVGYMNFRYKWSFAEREKRNLYYDHNERNNTRMKHSLQTLLAVDATVGSGWAGSGTFTTSGALLAGGSAASGTWQNWGNLNSGIKAGEIYIGDVNWQPVGGNNDSAGVGTWSRGWGYDPDNTTYTLSFTAVGGGSAVGTDASSRRLGFAATDSITTDSIENYTRWYATVLNNEFLSNDGSDDEQRDTQLVGGSQTINAGIHEGLGYDHTMNFSGAGFSNMVPLVYETKLSLQSPVSLFANRQAYNLLAFETGKVRDDYLEFSNGHDTSQTYLCPVGDSDMTYNRSHFLGPASQIYVDSKGTNEYAPDAGSPTFASSSFMRRELWQTNNASHWSSTKQWHSDWHFVTFGGSYIAFRQSKFVADKAAYTEHWNEIQAPSGQDFFHSHWKAWGSQTKTVILHNGELKVKGVGDVFHLRACTLSDDFTSSDTNSKYRLHIGYYDNTTSDNRPTLTRTFTSFSGTPCVSIDLRPHLFATDATGANNRDLSPVYQDQNGAISAEPEYGRELWYDVDVLFDFSSQEAKVFIDGYTQATVSMNSKPGGGAWTATDLYGWNLDWTCVRGDSVGWNLTTLIDRAAMHIPISNGLLGSSLMSESGVAPHIESFAYKASQNMASTFDFTLADDTKLQNLMPLVNGASKTEWRVIAFANQMDRPFYQGIMTGVDFKQNSQNRSLDVTIKSTDTLGVADTILPIYEEDTGATTHRSFSAIQQDKRQNETVGLYESLHFGTMPLRIQSAELGFTYYDGAPENEADVKGGDRFGPSSNARTVGFSAHPIQMYVCEDADGPNYVDWSWWGWVGDRIEDDNEDNNLGTYLANDSFRAIHFIDYMHQAEEGTNRMIMGIRSTVKPFGSNYMTGTNKEGRFGNLGPNNPLTGSSYATGVKIGEFGFITNQMGASGSAPIQPYDMMNGFGAYGSSLLARRNEQYDLDVNLQYMNRHDYESLNREFDFQWMTFVQVNNLDGAGGDADTQSDATAIHATSGLILDGWDIRYDGYRHMRFNEIDDWKVGNVGSNNPMRVKIDMDSDQWIYRHSMPRRKDTRTGIDFGDLERDRTSFPSTYGLHTKGGRPVLFQYSLQVYEHASSGRNLHNLNSDFFKPGDAITLIPKNDLSTTIPSTWALSGSGGNNQMNASYDLIGLTVTCTGYRPPASSGGLATITFETPSELCIPKGGFSNTTNTPTGNHQRTSLKNAYTHRQTHSLGHYDWNKLSNNAGITPRPQLGAQYNLQNHIAIGSIGERYKPKYRDTAMVYDKSTGQGGNYQKRDVSLHPRNVMLRAQHSRWMRDLTHSPFFRAQFGVISKYPYWRHGAESSLYRYNYQSYPEGFNGADSAGYTYPTFWGISADRTTSDTTWTFNDVGLWYHIEQTKQEHRGYPIIDLVNYKTNNTEYIIPSAWTDPSHTTDLRFAPIGQTNFFRLRKKSGSSFSLPSDSMGRGAIICTTGYSHPELNGVWQIITKTSSSLTVVKIDQFITSSDISGSSPTRTSSQRYSKYGYKDPDKIIAEYDEASVARIKMDGMELHFDQSIQGQTKQKEKYADLADQEGCVWYGSFNLTNVKGHTETWKRDECIYSLRKVDESNGYKHIWVLWSDMENGLLSSAIPQPLGNANSWKHKKNFGLITPISENYQVSLSFADQYKPDGTLDKYTELKIGDDVDIWEFDSEQEPITNRKWSQINRECSGFNQYLPTPMQDWTRIGGSFAIVDCSKFWNLNTVAVGGRVGYSSGGLSTIDDYDTEHHGFAFLVDSYWKEALTSEFTLGPGESSVRSSSSTRPLNAANNVGLKYHENADYFFNDSTSLVNNVEIGDHYLEVYDNRIFQNEGCGIIVCRGGTLDLRDGRETELQVYTFKWKGTQTDTTNGVMYIGGSPTHATGGGQAVTGTGSSTDNFVFVKAYTDVIGPKTAKMALDRDAVDWHTGSQVQILYDSTGSTEGAWSDVQVYTTPAAIFACRLLMNIEGRIASEASGTYYINDKFRWLQTFAHCRNWSSQLSLMNISDIANVPNTFNMTRTGIAYNDNFNGSELGDTDNFGNVYDAKGQTLIGILNGLSKQGVVGRDKGDILTFSWGIGRDNRLNFRPVINSAYAFNRNNILMSDLSTELRTQADYVRVYYKDNQKYVDFPSTPTVSNPRWLVEHKPKVSSHDEAKAVAQMLYEQHKSPTLKASVSVKRTANAGETLRNLENHKMLSGGRYGYVQDTIAHSLACDVGSVGGGGANSHDFMHDEKAGLSPFSRFGGFQRMGRVNATQGMIAGSFVNNAEESFHTHRRAREEYDAFVQEGVIRSADRRMFNKQAAHACIPLETHTMAHDTAYLNRAITPLLIHAPHGDRYKSGGLGKIIVTRSGSDYNITGALMGKVFAGSGGANYTSGGGTGSDPIVSTNTITIPTGFDTGDGIHELFFYQLGTQPDTVLRLSFLWDRAGWTNISGGLSDGASMELEFRIAPTYSYTEGALGGNWGANSLSNCLQVAYVQNGMPKVSETTGNQLRLAIMVNDDYVVDDYDEFRPHYEKPRPIYRLYLIDYNFDDTTTGTSGMPSDSSISAASGLNRSTTMAASLAHASNGYTSIDFRGSGLYEVAVPSTYSSSTEKIVFSIDAEYLDAVIAMTCSHKRWTDDTVGLVAMNKNRNDLEGGMGATDNIYTIDSNERTIFPLGQSMEKATGLVPADGMRAYLSPKLKIVDDLAFIPNTTATLSDSNLELTNETMVITSVNWNQTTENTEDVKLNLEKQEGKYTYSMVKTFADMKLERQQPPERPVPPPTPPPTRPPGQKPPGGGGWGDGYNPEKPPLGPPSGGGGWDKDGGIPFDGNKVGGNRVGINAMSDAITNKINGKMDLKNQMLGDGAWGILGTKKPAASHSHDSSIQGIGMKMEPSSGSATHSSEGISLSGIGGLASIETPTATTGEVQSFTTNFTVPNDASDNTIEIVAKASLPKPVGKAVATIVILGANAGEYGTGRTLSITDADGLTTQWTTESGVGYSSSVFNKIGLDGASTTVHVAQAFEQAINAAVTNNLIDVTVSRTDSTLTITQGSSGLQGETYIVWEETTENGDLPNEIELTQFTVGGGDAYLQTTVDVVGIEASTPLTHNVKIENGDSNKIVSLFPKQKISGLSAGNLVNITVKRTPGSNACGGDDTGLYQSVMLTGFEAKVRRNTTPSDKSYTKNNLRPY